MSRVPAATFRGSPGGGSDERSSVSLRDGSFECLSSWSLDSGSLNSSFLPHDRQKKRGWKYAMSSSVRGCFRWQFEQVMIMVFLLELFSLRRFKGLLVLGVVRLERRHRPVPAQHVDRPVLVVRGRVAE